MYRLYFLGLLLVVTACQLDTNPYQLSLDRSPTYRATIYKGDSTVLRLQQYTPPERGGIAISLDAGDRLYVGDQFFAVKSVDDVYVLENEASYRNFVTQLRRQSPFDRFQAEDYTVVLTPEQVTSFVRTFKGDLDPTLPATNLTRQAAILNTMVQAGLVSSRRQLDVRLEDGRFVIAEPLVVPRQASNVVLLESRQHPRPQLVIESLNNQYRREEWERDSLFAFLESVYSDSGEDPGRIVNLHTDVLRSELQQYGSTRQNIPPVLIVLFVLLVVVVYLIIFGLPPGLERRWQAARRQLSPRRTKSASTAAPATDAGTTLQRYTASPQSMSEAIRPIEDDIPIDGSTTDADDAHTSMSINERYARQYSSPSTEVHSTPSPALPLDGVTPDTLDDTDAPTLPTTPAEPTQVEPRDSHTPQIEALQQAVATAQAEIARLQEQLAATTTTDAQAVEDTTPVARLQELLTQHFDDAPVFAETMRRLVSHYREADLAKSTFDYLHRKTGVDASEQLLQHYYAFAIWRDIHQAVQQDATYHDLVERWQRLQQLPEGRDFEYKPWVDSLLRLQHSAEEYRSLLRVLEQAQPMARQFRKLAESHIDYDFDNAPEMRRRYLEQLVPMGLLLYDLIGYLTTDHKDRHQLSVKYAARGFDTAQVPDIRTFKADVHNDSRLAFQLLDLARHYGFKRLPVAVDGTVIPPAKMRKPHP